MTFDPTFKKKVFSARHPAELVQAVSDKLKFERLIALAKWAEEHAIPALEWYAKREELLDRASPCKDAIAALPKGEK